MKMDPHTDELYLEYSCGEEHVSITFDKDEVEQFRKCINYIDENKIINKPLKYFTIDELKQICCNNVCETCPLQFLKKGCSAGVHCPIVLHSETFKNEYRFYKNYIDAMDREISIKESDLKDG